MQISDIAHLLESIPEFAKRVVYRAWQKGKAPPLPWICYYETNTDNFAADGIAYHVIKNIVIELYTDYKNPVLESKVEEALTSAGVFWNSDESFIDDESMYLKSYEIEV